MSPIDHRSAIEAVFQESYAVVLASVATRYRDIDLAEEAVQDALVEALRTWPEQGVPDNPGGWISAGGTASSHRPDPSSGDPGPEAGRPRRLREDRT
ncbi:MAG TPA: hypothetical protein VIH55_05700 [Acidimicrobiia bacterium]